MPRIEMTQHYNSIECCHYRYDLIKQTNVASLGLVLPVPCLKWVGLNFFPPSLIVSFVLASGFKFATKPCNSLYSPILVVPLCRCEPELMNRMGADWRRWENDNRQTRSPRAHCQHYRIRVLLHNCKYLPFFYFLIFEKTD